MTILVLVRILNQNQEQYKVEHLDRDTFRTELESYIHGLIEAGYFWEAYVTITADDFFLTSSIKFRSLKAIWEAITKPHFVPALYGLDAMTSDILTIDVQTAMANTHCQTLLFVSPDTIGRTARRSMLKTLTIIKNRLKDYVQKLPSSLTPNGMRWVSPRQQLDYEYVHILERRLTRGTGISTSNMQKLLKCLQEVRDEASSTGYHHLASNIDLTRDRLVAARVQSSPSNAASSQSSGSTKAAILATLDVVPAALIPVWLFLNQTGHSTNTASKHRQRTSVACRKSRPLPPARMAVVLISYHRKMSGAKTEVSAE